MNLYANVIVDISIDKLDKTFQYVVPEELRDEIKVGMQVDIPFGNRTITGYVLELTDVAEYDTDKMKALYGIAAHTVQVESELIELAAWMRTNYGATMNQALKTVLPVKQKMKPVEHKELILDMEEMKARAKLALYESKRNLAKARLLRELLNQSPLDYTLVTQKLAVSSATIKSLANDGVLHIESYTSYRNPVKQDWKKDYHLTLNEYQQAVVSKVRENMEKGVNKTYLLKGVTGSGKTEVYMELIARTVAEGKKAIVLIPEIALTYQTLMRFYRRFGERVSILNSKLSAGERYDQYERAKRGEIDIMIGPRSALFTPFEQIGLIIIDEEHETSYKSESAPRYHAREVAIRRAGRHGASVILGSATPSVDSFYQVQQGNFELLTLEERVDHKPLPTCEVVDLRAELKAGNRSILSVRLQELMEERLEKGEQTMLFMNRRGLFGFMSCRSCGTVIKCPHCDVSLSLHQQNEKKMVCHYCGYETQAPNLCPSCGSKYIGAFKAGTQRVEQMVQERFPQAKILRMDSDTTRSKDSYEKILQAFANQEADILIGTQMIVKGHDFPNVTLVGVLAADMSLHVSDYHAAERTFQLLTQAVGRAGRGINPGQAVIQTYDPTHFAILTAKEQDYLSFYKQEIAYRSLMSYPPVSQMLVIHCYSKEQDKLEHWSVQIADEARAFLASSNKKVLLIGPADASIMKINDIYHKVIYMKGFSYDTLIACKDYLEQLELLKQEKLLLVQFDFNPSSGF